MPDGREGTLARSSGIYIGPYRYISRMAKFGKRVELCLLFVILFCTSEVLSQFDCTFDNGTCSWTENDVDPNWNLHSGSTTTGDTGPDGDYPTGAGQYLYVESSDPFGKNLPIRLISPQVQVQAGGTKCFEFYYHMYGSTIGDLKVFVTRAGEDLPVDNEAWIRSGNQGNQWNLGEINITRPDSVPFVITVEAYNRETYYGDIAIDYVSIRNGLCSETVTTPAPTSTPAPAPSATPSPSECDFENPDICGYWQQNMTDDLNWIRIRGQTSTPNTGPSNDHTYGNDAGYYMYVESSTPNQEGHTAQLWTTPFPAQGGHCIEFFYHMWGEGMGTLNVYALPIGGDVTATAPIWTRSGDQGNKWNMARANASELGDFQIVFEGINGQETSDMAIDDVIVSNTSTCQEPTADICGTTMTYPGTLESPGFPSPYANNIRCNMTLRASSGRLTRLQFQSVDLRDDGDGVMVEDQYGAVTWVTGSEIPKTFLSTVFHVTFISDSTNTNGTGFELIYDEYPRDAVPVKDFFYQVSMKPGKALHLYSNDYPMHYDDNTHYIWNITSSNHMTFTMVDVEMEERDWMVVTAYSTTFDPEPVLFQMGTPTENIGQITVAHSNYVIVEFRTDYSGRASGFHIIVEPNSVAEMEEKPVSSSCGGNFTLDESAEVFSLPTDTADLQCVYRITNSDPSSRIRVFVDEMTSEDGVDALHVFSGLDPTNWNGYRRQLTGSVNDEVIFINEGHGVTLVFTSGSANVSRSFTVSVEHVQDYGCGGTLDLTASNGEGSIRIGNFSSSMTHVYCQWLVRTSILTNVNVRVSYMMTESLYDMLEIGYGSIPTDVGSRLKLMTGDVQNQTYSTYNGDLWIVFSAEDMMADEVNIELVLDDDACLIDTRLDLNGVIASPQLPGGFYPNDADCQWIIQVRGGFQVRIHFTEFDLELGHDKLIIGGSNLVDESFGTAYIVITGSELPNDVVSRFNGLNIRFTSDSSGTRSGFSLTYEEFFDCPTGYSYNPSNDTCYKFVDTPADWFNARYDCNDVADGDIVVVNDQAENDYVLEMINAMKGNDSRDWWIGYYDAAINGVWTWVDCGADTDFAETKWQTGAPNNLDDNHCAYMNLTDGMYNDDDCFSMRRYVCEITRKNYVDSDCYPSNFQVLAVDDSSVSLSFNASEYLCDVAGYLIRYNTTANGDFIQIELEGALNSAVTITDLSPATTYLFELTTCTVSYGCYGYSTALSVLGTTTCPDNYEVGPNGHCYRFRILDLGSWWSTGRRTCDNVADSDLVIINDQAELDFLTMRSREVNPNMTWWVGYSDQSVESEWRWVDCSESTDFQMDLWAPGSPGNGRLDCAALQPSGDLVSLVCDETLSYICEISPKEFELQDANPHDLAAVATSSSILVTWSPSPTSCDVVGYRIQYWLADEPNADVSFQIVYGGDADSATIDGILPDRMYNVTVGAFLSQDYELSPVGPVTVRTVAAIILQCSPTTMSVRVPLERLGGATLGSDLQLMNDGDCQGVISEDGMAIVISTNLTSCNNDRREDSSFEYYSNTVVEREYGVVTRVSDVYIPFTCYYNRTGRVGLRSYELKNYRLNVTEESSGQYAFALDIYRDEAFEEKYLEEEYPVDMEINEDLYFGASVPSQDGTLDLSITRCVATPSNSYNDDQYVFIEDGCSTDENTVIRPDQLDFVGVTMKTFRFVGLGNRVYIHCDLLVCDATTGNLTECDVSCPSGLNNARQRRDVTGLKYTLARTRISRGPIRFRRSSLDIGQKDWISYDEKDTMSSFNPWMLAIVAMGTVMIVLLVVVVVVVKKMTSVMRSQHIRKDDEASVPLMSE